MIGAMDGCGVVETVSPCVFRWAACKNRCEKDWAETGPAQEKSKAATSAGTSSLASAHPQRDPHDDVRAKYLRSCIPAIGKVALNKLHLEADRARGRGPISVDALLIGTAGAKRTRFGAVAK